MLFNYQSSCIAHQATCLFYQMSKCLSTTFLIFLISYFQTAYESVLFRVILADSLYIIPSLPREASEMFQCIKYEDKREVFGLKIHSFSTLDRIKKYDDSDNEKNAEKPYSIKVGETKRTINLYAIATTKFQIAV